MQLILEKKKKEKGEKTSQNGKKWVGKTRKQGFFFVALGQIGAHCSRSICAVSIRGIIFSQTHVALDNPNTHTHLPVSASKRGQQVWIREPRTPGF